MTQSDNGERVLTYSGLEAITRFRRLEETTYADVEALVRDSEAAEFQPNPDLVEELRSGVTISYSEARRSRPLSWSDVEGGEDGREALPCIVCSGRLTPVIDVADLCKGKTFINFNLFPMVFPFPPSRGGGGRGMHFLQWNSTFHDADLHNVCSADMTVILMRLAALERFLLHSEAPGFPRTAEGHSGYAAIMKNRGLKVGGSVEHGHQQIAHLAVLPRAIASDRDLLRNDGMPFAATLRHAALPDLLISETEGGVKAVVSPFMRRPLEAVIIPPDHGGEYLHHMPPELLASMGRTLRDLTGALRLLMEIRNISFDYNIAFHTGPIGLLYIEILPWTQPYGGFEHLGHFLCQEEPATTARAYREVLGVA